MEHLGILVPLAGIALAAFSVWAKHQRRIAEMHINATAGLSAEKAAQYASHTRELEERVRVLERIVTDKGYDVATQIEALRDTARVEQLLESRREATTDRRSN